MKVSLVSTVKDAGPAIHEFLASVAAQTRQPDEVIVVDGGSGDGSFEALEAAEGVTVISEPGANIARGRNLAIRSATHDVIAVTDADCALDPFWLERILEPIEEGADVAAGFYRAVAETFLERCSAAIAVREPGELGAGWMPSSRSIAFTRSAFDAVGGYPEWLAIGEDMYFNHGLVKRGVRMRPVPQATVAWKMRPTLRETWRQYFRYAEGDGLAGMYPKRHLIRFGAYGFLTVALGLRNPWLLGMASLGGAAYAARPLGRGWRRSVRLGERGAMVVAIPALMALIDLAKMAGYLRGLAARSPHLHPSP
jgi:glycosyltransferase involved in cell wall biosynthesis